MKIFLYFIVFLLSFSQFASPVLAESTINARIVRAFGDFANDNIWRKFEAYVEPELIEGRDEPTIHTNVLFKLMFESARKQTLSNKTKESDKLLYLIHPDKRNVNDYSELAKDQNNHLNLGETITLKEVRRLATLETDEGGFFFPVDTEYLQKLKESKSVENEAESKVEQKTETQKSEVLLPKIKPEAPVMMYQVEAVGNWLADIPSMKNQISELEKKIDKVVNRPQSESGVVNEASLIVEADVALVQEVSGLAEGQKKLFEEQARLTEDQLRISRLIEKNQFPIVTPGTSGEVDKELVKQSILEMLGDRQLLSKYPYLTAFVVIFTMLLILWFITKPIFWFFKSRGERKWRDKVKLSIKESVKEDLENSHTAIKTTIADIQVNQTNLTDRVEQIQVAQLDLKDEVRQVSNQSNSIVDKVNIAVLQSSINVNGLEKLDSVKGNASVAVTVSSTLDDTPSYKVVFKNKDSNNFLVYGVWREEDKKGNPEIVYPKNTDFRRTFIRAYVKNRLSVKIDDEKEVIAA